MIRDDYRLISAFINGFIRFEEYKYVDWNLVPHKLSVFMNNPKENIKTHIRQFIIGKFECNSFTYNYLLSFSNSNNVTGIEIHKNK